MDAGGTKVPHLPLQGLELKLEGAGRCLCGRAGKRLPVPLTACRRYGRGCAYGGLGEFPATGGGETERAFGVMDIIHGIESAYEFKTTWFGSDKGIMPWQAVSTYRITGDWHSGFDLWRGLYIAQKGLEAITGKELSPAHPLCSDGAQWFGICGKEQRKFDWTNPVKSIQEGEFYQWLFGKPEVEQALPPSQTFVDSSAMLGQGMVMAPQQATANTTIHLTMNNSFAVDREETADYCIRELYRRMRAELDGARTGGGLLMGYSLFFRRHPSAGGQRQTDGAARDEIQGIRRAGPGAGADPRQPGAADSLLHHRVPRPGVQLCGGIRLPEPREADRQTAGTPGGEKALPVCGGGRR